MLKVSYYIICFGDAAAYRVYTYTRYAATSLKHTI